MSDRALETGADELTAVAAEKFALLKDFSMATSLLLREGFEAIQENLTRRETLIIRMQDTDVQAHEIIARLPAEEGAALRRLWEGEPPAADTAESIRTLHLRVLSVRTQAEALLQQEERIREMVAHEADALREEMRGLGDNRRALAYYRSLVPEPRSGLSLDENS